MSTPAVHYLAFYLLVFVGVEVTIGGAFVDHSIGDLVTSFSRLNRHFYNPGKRRRPLFWVYFFRFLWWLDYRKNHPSMGQ